MAEEQEWHEANNHVLCANNCGFFGSPTTLNLCSKCYKDHRLKEQQMSEAKLAVEKSLSPVTSSSSNYFSSGPVLSLSVASQRDFISGDGSGGFKTAATEPLRLLQPARGTHGVHVQVWDHFLWDPSVP